MRLLSSISILAIGLIISIQATAIPCNMISFQKWMKLTSHFYNAEYFNLKSCYASKKVFTCALTTTNDHCLPEKNPCSRAIYVQNNPLEKVIADDYKEVARCTMQCAIVHNETMVKCCS